VSGGELLDAVVERAVMSVVTGMGTPERKTRRSGSVIALCDGTYRLAG